MSSEKCAESTEEFLSRYNDITTKGYTTLCLAIGHKLNLFTHIPREPTTSSEIAKSATLKERYVREWLNSMVVGNIVEVTPDGNKYWLPEERRQVLTSKNQTLGVFFPIFSNVFDDIVSCFKLDGPNGMPYDAYRGFHEIMAAASDDLIKANFLPNLVPQVPELTQTLGGQEKNQAPYINDVTSIFCALEQGAFCLDIGCGHGLPSFLIAKQFKKSTCYGIDFTESALKLANDQKKEHQLENLEYYQFDAGNLPKEWSDKFDYVTSFDSIHDQARPDKSLAEIYRVLKAGGYFSMVEINTDSNVAMNKSAYAAPFLYTASLFHCMPVSLYFEGGMGLGTCWGRQKAVEMLTTAGLVDITFAKGDPNNFNFHCISRKPLN